MKEHCEGLFNHMRRVINYRKSIFDTLEKRSGNHLWLTSSLRDVKKVIIICSPSRSGSSMLTAILKRMPGVYALSGEGTPFYKLNIFSLGTFPADERMAGVLFNQEHYSNLSRDFLSDLSVACDQNNIFEDNAMIERYIDDLALRFSLQWPLISFSYDLFKQLAAQAINAYRKKQENFCKEEFYLELLWFLRQEYGAINPYYYDIPENMIKKKFRGLNVPYGPPNKILTIEEPLFILLSPHGKVTYHDLSEHALLLKTTADAYRMHLVESLFPGAQIKIIYLLRNPLGCINGLYDGWLHRGFYSHNIEFFMNEKIPRAQRMLEIKGYSDRYAWGKRWWNYDLPPKWQEYTRKRLEDVCAFQWYSAHNALQEYFIQSKKQYCLVRYENILKSQGAMMDEIGKIIDFIGASRGVLPHLGLDTLPITQATQIPQPFRWRKRKDMLLPLLDDPLMFDACVRLGYNKDAFEEWS